MIPTAFIVAFLTISICIALVLVLGVCQFGAMQHLIVVQKRYPIFVKVESIVNILFLTVVVPLRMYLDKTETDFSHPLAIIGSVTYFISIHFTADIEACRLWLIHFDLQYLDSVRNSKWKVLIDHSIAERDWYLSNKNRWGNKHFVTKLAVVHFVMIFAMYAIVRIFLGALTGSLLRAALMLPTCSLILISYCKLPSRCQVNDVLFFHEEFRATVINVGIALFGCALAITFFYIFDLETVAQVMATTIGIWMLPLPSVISTIWIPYKIRKSAIWNTRNLSIALVPEHSPNSVNLECLQSNYDSLDMRLRETLQDEFKFECLMDWMSKEFSSEALLSAIEFTQFKAVLNEHFLKSGGENTEDTKEYILFHAKIPKSTIVYGHAKAGYFADESHETAHESTRLKEIASGLYTKYIRTNCEYEVNISWKLRITWDSFHHEKYPQEDWGELKNAIDEVISEMMYYVRDSFGRYEMNSGRLNSL